MISTVNGIQVEPPTEASSPANSISIPPDVPNAIALKNAIIQGNIGAVEALIESGVDVNSEFPGEGTALQIALQVKQPQTECVDLLLDHGADIYKKGGNDQNALVIAVVEELNDVLDLMVQGGYVRNEADLPEDQRLVFDLTILHIAVCCWNQQALKRLLESPARGMINYQGLHGQTPLHFTTKTDQEAVGILALVMHDRWEVPPIRAMDCDEVHCHEVRKCEIAQLLVDNGARGDIRDRKGSTALMKCFGSPGFVACRFTTTSASLYEGYGEIKLEPRIHAVLWIMAKSFSSQRNNLARARPESTRFHLTILESRGNNHSIIDQLLRDALLWVKAEGMAKTQIQDLINLDDMYALERLPHDKGHDEVAMAQFEDSVRELDSYLIDSIKHLRQTSKELIELRSSEVYINKREHEASQLDYGTYLDWTTFRCAKLTECVLKFIFLPLTFVSSLFGMNVNVLESNPPWWIYLPFAFSTLGLTMVVWLTFKRYPSIEDKAERVFRKLAR
ncbi:hypothetical protein CEP53_007211 [Fusarium sp. AF-6]|nr:hypothetical protein CEP53_007211 [Fusarium sp. AF-6]